jgi:aminomethyltransferase
LPDGTPFFPRTSTRSGSQFFYDWSSLLVSPVYTSVEDELRAMRETAVIIDMSPLYKLDVRGADAPRFVEQLVTKDTSRLDVGKVLYTPWVTDEGLLVNDGLVFRVAEDLYRISTDQSLQWFRGVAERIGADVEIEDVSRDWGILSLQGPSSRDILERATGSDWKDFRFSRVVETTIGGSTVELSRQGFTGELGYELWVRAGEALPMLDAILDAGEHHQLQIAGSIAVDIARVEAGLVLVSADYSGAGPDNHSVRFVPDNAATPAAMGMDYLVDLDKKDDFVGRDALLAERERGGPAHQLVGLELDWRAVSKLFEDQERPALVRPEVHWVPLEARVGGERIGRATSLTWSPTAGRLIAFGILAREHAALGGEVEVVWDRDGASGAVPATVIELPFVKRRRATA